MSEQNLDSHSHTCYLVAELVPLDIMWILHSVAKIGILFSSGENNILRTSAQVKLHVNIHSRTIVARLTSIDVFSRRVVFNE